MRYPCLRGYALLVILSTVAAPSGVEADILRLRSAVLSDVPFAHRLRDIARVRQELCNGGLALQASWLAVHRRSMKAMAVRNPTCQQGCARRRAARLRVAGRELQPTPSKLVKVWRRRTYCDTAAVTAKIGVPHIVRQNDDDVGPR